MAATNRDIESDSRQGRLRPDLYFRINGVSLLIPPLRDRPLDIEALATSFLAAACRDLDRSFPLTLSSAALDRLRLHSWPGNVRELRNAIERAAVMSTGSTILPEDLPPSTLAANRVPPEQPASPSPKVAPRPPVNLPTEMKAFENARILEALEHCNGNQSEAARRLGIPRRTLVSRLTELGLTRRRTSDAP